VERRVAHLKVPCFAVAVERVRDPSLRDRPVAVAAGRSSRAVVVEASPEARAEGVRTGMPLAEARSFCPALTVISPDPDLQQRARAALIQVAGRYSPLVEPHAGGRLDVDLTGTRRLFGAAKDAACRLQKEIAVRLRLPGTLGLSINKLVSGVAARVAPPFGLADVRPGDEAPFLSPLPARILPGVRPEPEGRLLSDLNLRQVAELSALPLPRLLLAFRERGQTLYRQARGLDDSPVRPPCRQPEIHEDETLGEDTNDDGLLLGLLALLVERAGRRLRAAGLEAGTARLAARFADGTGASRRLRLPPLPGDDPSLLALLRPPLEAIASRRTRIRWLGVTLSGLERAARQMRLFAPPDIALARALDRIRERHGAAMIRQLRGYSARCVPLAPNAGPLSRV
jgi:DNA polymerase IV